MAAAAAGGPCPWHPRALLLWLVAAHAALAHDRPQAGAQLLEVSQTPLRTSGRYIVDNRGERVKWACVNWYGAYSTTHAVGGLEVRPMADIVDRIVGLGFNCVRMMYSTQGYVHNPRIEDAVLKANPQLKGKRFLEVFDLTIQAMTDAGLMVIVNNHNSKSGWCCHYSQDEGIWYVPEYNESRWMESLVFFADRYKDNPLVVAFDLRNEVHDYKETHLTWGDGNPLTDWGAAATRAGNAVLQASPDTLIVVMAMCFGMDLRRMREKPVELMYPNRVVYQAHNYLEYQVFNNIEKSIGPWHMIRTVTMYVIAALLLLLLVLRHVWASAGKPQPPRGSVAVSVGLWFALFMLAAMVISWNAYTFGNKFCSVSAESDILPWFIGSAALGVASLLVATVGSQHLWRQSRAKGGAALAAADAAAAGHVAPEIWAAPPEDQVPTERAELGVVVPGQPAQPHSSLPPVLGQGPGDTAGPAPAGTPVVELPPAAGLERTGTAGVCGSPSAEARTAPLDAMASGDILSLAMTAGGGQGGHSEAAPAAAAGGLTEGKLGEPPRPQEAPRSGGLAELPRPAPAARPRRALLVCCGSAGCSSCSRAWGLILRSAAGQVRRLLGLNKPPAVSADAKAQQALQALPPCEWDVGMCCLLQCSVLATICVLVLLVLYIFGHIVPTYWWMERHLDGLWGFALEEGLPTTAPVWMGEFGVNVRGEYWLNFVRYLAIRDVDFAYWALNGIKWAEGEIDGTSGEFIKYDEPRWEDESFGILDRTYNRVQHTWKLLDLQGLMASPATWQPDAIPCRREVDPSCGAR